MKRILTFALALIMVLSIFSAVSFAASAPAKVTGVKVTSVTADSAKVSWKAVSKASGYIIYKYIKNSNKYVKLATVTGTAKTIKNLKEETKYTVCVSAYKKASGKTTIGKKSELVSFTTKSESFATKKLFYNYIRKNFTLATSSGFPTETKSGSIISAKIFDFDSDKKLEMVTFSIFSGNLTVSYFEVNNGKVKLVNKLQDFIYLGGGFNWDNQECAFLKGSKILIMDSFVGGNMFKNKGIVLSVKNGKLKKTKEFIEHANHGYMEYSEAVSGKEYELSDSGMNEFYNDVKKAGFKNHDHKFEKASDISKDHIYAFAVHDYSKTECTLFVDRTNLKSHMK